MRRSKLSWRSAGRHWATGLAAACLAAAGCDDSDPVRAVQPPASSPAQLVVELEAAYTSRDIDRFAPLFHPAFVFVEHVFPDTMTLDRDEWICLHRELFAPSGSVPQELWLAALTIQADVQGEFTERAEYYASPAQPQGLDPERWRVTGAIAEIGILFETKGETDYLVQRHADFVVAEDLDAQPGAQRFTFYRITAFADVRIRTGSEPKAWGAVLALYGGSCGTKQVSDRPD
jgi:hypothetical protein